MGRKYALHQFPAYTSVKPRTDFHILVQAYFSLYDDKTANALFRQRHCRLNDLFENILASLHHALTAGEKRRGAYLGQCAPNVTLKDDDNDKNNRAEKIIENPVQRKQAERP